MGNIYVGNITTIIELDLTHLCILQAIRTQAARFHLTPAAGRRDARLDAHVTAADRE